uniref:Uncharacterized protein n=2 Tax=Sinocyclocheilus TaxID=75365 RepID=A0A673N097_9TELE
MELGARLEEKRKAIEAQKKRIEAIFAKHRQRLGKSAFLQLKKEILLRLGCGVFLTLASYYLATTHPLQLHSNTWKTTQNTLATA